MGQLVRAQSPGGAFHLAPSQSPISDVWSNAVGEAAAPETRCKQKGGADSQPNLKRPPEGLRRVLARHRAADACQLIRRAALTLLVVPNAINSGHCLDVRKAVRSKRNERCRRGRRREPGRHIGVAQWKGSAAFTALTGHRGGPCRRYQIQPCFNEKGLSVVPRPGRFRACSGSLDQDGGDHEGAGHQGCEAGGKRFNKTHFHSPSRRDHSR